MRSDDSWSPLAQAKTIAAELGVGFLALGFDPKWRVADVPMMPKERYRWGLYMLLLEASLLLAALVVMKGR